MTTPKPYRPRHRRRQLLSLRIDAALYDRLHAIMERDNLPQTDAVEMAIEAWVSASEADDNERQIYRVSNNVQR